MEVISGLWVKTIGDIEIDIDVTLCITYAFIFIILRFFFFGIIAKGTEARECLTQCNGWSIFKLSCFFG